MAEARGPALKSPARTGGRAEAGSALARMNSSTAITWASRTAVESRGEVHAVGVDPGGPYVERTFGQGSWQSRRDCAWRSQWQPSPLAPAHRTVPTAT
jgi:hypothetical protein